MPTNVNGVGSVTGTSPTSGVGGTGSTTASATNELDKDAFLKLLVAQLKYQNPLSPTDPQSLMSQTAQYSTVEQLQNLTKLLADTNRAQSLTTAAALVGRDVTAKDMQGSAVKGRVDAVSRGGDGSIVLHVGNAVVALDDVSEVT